MIDYERHAARLADGRSSERIVLDFYSMISASRMRV